MKEKENNYQVVTYKVVTCLGGIVTEDKRFDSLDKARDYFDDSVDTMDRDCKRNGDVDCYISLYSYAIEEDRWVTTQIDCWDSGLSWPEEEE